MTEFVAIPKDLYEKMVDAVGELRAVYLENDERDENEGTEGEPDPDADTDYERIDKLTDEIEENWPEESFSGGYPAQGSGHKFVRQTRLSGPNQPR